MSVYRIEGNLGSDGKIIIAHEVELENEDHLERLFENSPIGLNQDELILWIGKQPRAQNDDKTIRPDLLGIDSEGDLVIVEFKRGRTPRDVIAQLFEYAAWASELSETQIIDIAESYFSDHYETGSNFHDRFQEVFGVPDIPTLNRSLRLFIVAKEITNEVAHVCQWLRTSLGLDITCIEVSFFQTKSNEMYIDVEVKVGEKDIAASYLPSSKGSQKLGRRRFQKNVTEIMWEAVQEHTSGDRTVKWTQEDIRQIITQEHKDFDRNHSNWAVSTECVNHDNYAGERDRYWKVKRGVYKLYDPQTDKEESENTPAAK